MKFSKWLLIFVLLGVATLAGRSATPVVAYAEGTYAVAFSPDGMYAAAGWGGGTARLWEVQSGALMKEFDCETDHVFSLAFSPDHKYFACGGFTGVVLFDAAKWTKLWTLPRSMGSDPASDDNGDVLYMAFTPDSKLLLTFSYHGARLWNVRTGALVRRFWDQNPTTSVVLSPDGQTVLTSSEEKGVWLWDRQTGLYLQRFTEGTDIWQAVNPYAGPFSPDGKWVVIGGYDGLHLWDIKARKDRRTIGRGGHVGLFSPDGSYVLSKFTTYGLGPMQVWDVQTGQMLHEFSKEEQDAEFSPDGKLLLTIEGSAFGPQQIFRLYDVSGWKERRRLSASFKLTSVHAFSPDSRYLLIGYLTVGAQIWDVNRGELLHTLE